MNDAHPAGHGTTQQHAVSWLRRAVVSGELKPGDRVAQEEIAQQIGVSVAPVREALRVLEQEGQLTYRPRRGYFVTELRIEDLEEIYGLRQLLEARAARAALPTLDDEAMERISDAARECIDAATAEDIAAELAANRRFHFEILNAPTQPHTMRMIQLLWDSTEAYRSLYYGDRAERLATIEAHDRILALLRDRDADALVGALDAHRGRALEFLRGVLAPR